MATSIREGKDQGGAVHELIRNTQVSYAAFVDGPLEVRLSPAIHLLQERAKVDLSMWEAADKDGSGSIGFDEFASMSCHVGMARACSTAAITLTSLVCVAADMRLLGVYRQVSARQRSRRSSINSMSMGRVSSTRTSSRITKPTWTARRQSDTILPRSWLQVRPILCYS